jgi:lambda repressor-like predicted transcriptional regulator
MSYFGAMDEHDQKIADIERELEFRGRRIDELKVEVDDLRTTLRQMEEWVQERTTFMEDFITTFGLELDDDNKYRNGEFIQSVQRLANGYDDLVGRYNKLVHRFNRNIASVQPVGRPLGATEAQRAQILKLHKAGKSSRWIAEELGLSRRAVTTVVDKNAGTDRTTTQRRLRLGLEPKRKDWRDVAIANLPRRATALRKASQKLLREAKEGRKV